MRSEKCAEGLGFGRGGFAHGGEAVSIFQMLVRFFLNIFRKQGDAVRIFQNIHLDSLLAKYFLRAGKICNITDNAPLKLTAIDQRRTDVTSAERRKDRGLAEIQAPRIPRGRRLAVIDQFKLYTSFLISLRAILRIL